MKNYFNLSLIIFLFFGSIIIGCKKNDVTAPLETKSTTEKFVNKYADDGIMVLGKTLENPSTIDVMEKAYQKIVKNGSAKISTEKSPVRVTHLYVQYRPKNWDEYDEIKNENKRALELFDYPLDKEIIIHGNKYHDPEVEPGKPTYQYTVVPFDYNFSKKVKYKILSEIYIPEFDEKIGSNNGRISAENESFIKAWNDEALKMTNNQNFISKKTKNTKVAFTPQGKIQTYDNRAGAYFPLQGIKVRVRRILTYVSTYTNSNGDYFIFPGFDGPVNYSLFYETPAFDIREGLYGQVWIDGPYQDTPWSINLLDGLAGQFYADIFRGAWRYHYGDISNLYPPIAFYSGAIKYSGMNESGNAQAQYNGNWAGLYPNIQVWRYSGSTPYKSDEIFSSTIHETAHAIHFKQMNFTGIQFSQVSEFIRESWAVGVEWMITQKEYKEKRGIYNYADPTYFSGTGSYYPGNYGYQNYLKTNSLPNYSNVFIDLVDNYNQIGGHYLPAPTPFNYYTGHTDNVTGYSFFSLQGCLNSIYGISSLSTKLKANKPSGVTDTQIDELISQY